jgi:hypothetical protein
LVWVSEKPQFGPYAGRVVASYYEPSLLLAVGPALAVGAYAFTHKSESALGLVGSITDLYPVDRELLFFDDFKAYPDGSKGEPFWSVVALNDTYGNRLMADFMIKSGWMIAGRAGTYQMGALLTGVKAREFKAEVEVELLDFDPKVSNYAYIVYAYKDADNYRSFQAHWNTNGRIYAIIGKVVAGKGYSAPAWPGLDTGVTFSKGSKVKIVGEVRGNTHTLTLIADGKPFKVSMADVSEEGLIGIGTARAYSQAFDNFKIYP